MAGRGPAGGMTRWMVDASNVIGSRPDGWWRDREGAARRLIDALREFAGEDDDVVVVLDAGPASWAGRDGFVEVAIAPRRGRNAADDEIARRLAADDDPALDPGGHLGRRAGLPRTGGGRLGRRRGRVPAASGLLRAAYRI